MKLIVLLVFTLQVCYGTETFQQVWKKPLNQPGLSGIHLKGNHLFLTVNDTDKEQKVLKTGRNKGYLYESDIKGLCFNTDGEFQWEVKVPSESEMDIMDIWLDATAVTPVTSEKYVYFLNVQGRLTCCSLDGQIIWQKTFTGNGGITPSQMIIHNNLLIVNLPNGQQRKPNTKKNSKPFNLYSLHALELDTGKPVWVSDKILNHACRYTVGKYNEKDVILASITELSHYSLGQGFKFYAISMESGECINLVEVNQFSQHFKALNYNQSYVSVSTKGSFELKNYKTGEIESYPVKKCDVYYKYINSGFEEKTPKDIKRDVPFGSLGLPTRASMNIFNDKLFYFSGGTNAIGCINLKTKKHTLVEVPIQIIDNKKIWEREEVVFSEGIFDSSGRLVRDSKGAHGRMGYGWGNGNISYPVKIDNFLYFLGGIGVIYKIDLNKDFTPDAVSSFSIDPKGEERTIGEMAFDQKEHLYIRSQKYLHKIKIR